MRKEENWDDFCRDHFGLSEDEFAKEVLDEALEYAKREARAEAKQPKTMKQAVKPKIEPAVTIPSPVGRGIDFGVDLPANHPWRTERKSIFTCPPKVQEETAVPAAKPSRRTPAKPLKCVKAKVESAEQSAGGTLLLLSVNGRTMPAVTYTGEKRMSAGDTVRISADAMERCVIDGTASIDDGEIETNQ